MNKESINPEYKQAVIKAIEYHFPNAKIILFGSRARGTNKSGADIDIAIDDNRQIKLRELSRARITLENLSIPLEVDLVDLSEAPQELKDIIKKEGIVWKN
jgi:predicted nucleotidyltransferase